MVLGGGTHKALVSIAADTVWLPRSVATKSGCLRAPRPFWHQGRHPLSSGVYWHGDPLAPGGGTHPALVSIAEDKVWLPRSAVTLWHHRSATTQHWCLSPWTKSCYLRPPRPFGTRGRRPPSTGLYCQQHWIQGDIRLEWSRRMLWPTGTDWEGQTGADKGRDNQSDPPSTGVYRQQHWIQVDIRPEWSQRMLWPTNRDGLGRTDRCR